MPIPSFANVCFDGSVTQQSSAKRDAATYKDRTHDSGDVCIAGVCVVGEAYDDASRVANGCRESCMCASRCWGVTK